MTKPPKKRFEYSGERETQVLLEDLHSQFRVFGEGLNDVRKKLGRLERIEEKLETLENDVSLIKLSLPHFASQITDHDRRLTTLESAS